MTRLEEMAARLDAALDKLEAATGSLIEAKNRAARDKAEIAGMKAEREQMLARMAELEDETRSLAAIAEEVEHRLDGAMDEVRAALSR